MYLTRPALVRGRVSGGRTAKTKPRHYREPYQERTAGAPVQLAQDSEPQLQPVGRKRGTVREGEGAEPRCRDVGDLRRSLSGCSVIVCLRN